MRRISLLLAALVSLVPAAPVLAGPGCGADFDLLTVDETIARVDPRIYTPSELDDLAALIASLDALGNDDGLLCSKQFKPNDGQDKQWIGPEDEGVADYVITMINDNHPKGSKS